MSKGNVRRLFVLFVCMQKKGDVRRVRPYLLGVYDYFFCCLVNVSISMDIKLYESYKSHSLRESPEASVADKREAKGKSNYMSLNCNVFVHSERTPKRL